MINSQKLEEYAQQGKNWDYVIEQFENLKKLLESFKTKEGKPVKVFLQGSYKNKTNIGHESDIDIVVYYEQVFGNNVLCRQDDAILNVETNINSLDIQNFKNTFPDATYTSEEFKLEIMNFLKRRSLHIVTEGKKTIKCQIPNKDFTFDIVCAFQYREYNYFRNLDTKYEEGNLIRDVQQNRIINFPKQTYQNSIKKNKEFCDGKYKETVRIFKNIMVNELTEEYQIPSFALESILYNVDDQSFCNNDKFQRCKSVVLDAIDKVKNSWEELLEPNELLFVKNIDNLEQEKVKIVLMRIAKDCFGITLEKHKEVNQQWPKIKF